MCQRHAMRYSHEKTASVVQIKEEQIEFYAQAILRIELEIKRIIGEDVQLKQKVDRIAKVKGLGLVTIVIVLCETNGFLLFNTVVR